MKMGGIVEILLASRDRWAIIHAVRESPGRKKLEFRKVGRSGDVPGLKASEASSLRDWGNPIQRAQANGLGGMCDLGYPQPVSLTSDILDEIR